METLLFLVTVVVICVIVTGVGGGIVMVAWNAVLPALFHLPGISFLQACGLWILVNTLVGCVRGSSK